jgi:MFS family permease
MRYSSLSYCNPSSNLVRFRSLSVPSSILSMSTSELQSPGNGSGYRALMKNRPFTILWIGQIISQVADKIFFVLLIDLVVHYVTPDFPQNTAKASVMMANTLPAVFLGFAAGIFVDRWSKKQILWASNLGRGLIIFMIPLLPKQLLFLLLIAAVESILTQFFAPAEQASIAVLVERKLLMPANALFSTTMIGSFVVGFAICPVLLGWANNWGGTYGGTYLVAGLYMVAAIVLAIVPFKEDKAVDAKPQHPWKEFKQGIKYIQKNPLLSNAMIQLAILYSVLAALIALAPGFLETLKEDQKEFSFILSCAGVGLILGAALLGQWGDRLKRWPLPLLGFLTMGTALVGFFFVQQKGMPIVLSLSLLLGLGASFVGVPMQTLIQARTLPDMRGKVFGVQNNLINIALSLPLAIAALIADLTSSVPGVLLSIGILVWIVGLWSWRSTRGFSSDDTATDG